MYMSIGLAYNTRWTYTWHIYSLCTCLSGWPTTPDGHIHGKYIAYRLLLHEHVNMSASWGFKMIPIH